MSVMFYNIPIVIDKKIIHQTSKNLKQQTLIKINLAYNVINQHHHPTYTHKIII